MRHPAWIRKRISPDLLSEGRAKVGLILEAQGVRTVCSDAHCPNQPECFARGCATFLLMGPHCTRACGFCSVSSGAPAPLDPSEPERVARASLEMGLGHVVMTSVTRDDLPDGGADHFAKAVAAVRSRMPEATVEILIPDFQGESEPLRRVVAAYPDVINHNVETVPRLYPVVRPGACFERSLALLRRLKEMDPVLVTKSGLMVGFGEEEAEVLDALRALAAIRCDVVTVGQYLAPSPAHIPVTRFVAPEQFEAYQIAGEDMGIGRVVAHPFARSSWQAAAAFAAVAGSSRQPLGVEPGRRCAC